MLWGFVLSSSLYLKMSSAQVSPTTLAIGAWHSSNKAASVDYCYKDKRASEDVIG